MATMRHSVVLLACSIALGGTWTGADGQSIRGRVTDGGSIASGVPIAGAVVVLLDSLGGRLRGALSGSDGLFIIQAETSGPYRLRAEMIGRKSIESKLFVAADTAFHVLVMPPEPIQLAGLDVESARRCSVRDRVARATHIVWEEAQKALRAESIVRQAAIYRFHVAQHERTLDADGDEVLDEKTRYLTQVNDDPFSSLDPDILARDGYVHEDGADTWIYGPSTDVLLSSGFQDTHCFALKQDGDRPGLVGLSFEPVPGRRLADIEGVLWLDQASAELRSLEFRYRNIPDRLLRGDYTGFAAFRRLGNGGWIIGRWRVGSPPALSRRRVTSLREEAGEVIRIEPIR